MGSSWGKQVGSMNEEPQVRGCYNFYLHTNQPGNSVGSPRWWKHEHQLQQQTNCLCRDTGGKGTLPARITGFNTLDNWGHKTPTQSKWKRTRKKRLKGHGPKHVHNTLGYIIIINICPRASMHLNGALLEHNMLVWKITSDVDTNNKELWTAVWVMLSEHAVWPYY